MSRNHWILSLITIGAFTACTDLPTDPTGSVDAQFTQAAAAPAISVTGSGHIATAAGDKRVFAFSAHQQPNGGVSGQFTLLITAPVAGSENPSITRLLAEVTCVSVSGNRAWVGGIVKNASNSEWIGRETGWAVEDNGEGAPAGDRISLLNIPNPTPGFAQRICDEQGHVPDQEVEAGTLRVAQGTISGAIRPTLPGTDPIVGSYENNLYADADKNCYHYVTISRIDASTLLWENNCPISWMLTATDDPAVYAIGPDSPYYGTEWDEDVFVGFAEDGSILYVTGPGLEPYERVGAATVPAVSRHSVSGGGTVEVSAGRSTYAFHATVDASGAARGQFEIHFSTNPWVIHGEVTCVAVDGGEARLGGVITRSSATNPAWQEGGEIIWFAADGGEGQAAAADQVSSFFSHAASDCTAPTWGYKDWSNGNVQIQALPG